MTACARPDRGGPSDAETTTGKFEPRGTPITFNKTPAVMLTQFSTPAVSLFIHPGANPESVASVEALTGQVTAFVANSWKIFMPQLARNYQKSSKAVLPAAHSPKQEVLQ